MSQSRFAHGLAALVLGATALAAQASPITYQFVLPSYSFNNDAALFGTSATVSFTVNNGNTTSANQAYTFGQVSQIGIAN